MKNQNAKRALSVLVIEDNEGDFVLIEDYLIEKFKTVQINRCESFIDFQNFTENQSNFDLVLLDLHLPDLSGIALIQKILSLKTEIPIIILTGYADISVAKESLKLGVDDFLIKDETTPGILHKSIEFAFSRRQYVQHIEAQNKKLSNIAWTQSHVVRAPLSRILGIINLIEAQELNREDLLFLLKNLKISCNEMDEIVRKITAEAQDIKLNSDNK